MSNIGQREKYMMILFGVVLVIFAMYMFGIRNLQSKYDSLIVEKAELEQQKAYLDSLRTQNAEAQAAIEQLKSDISEVERSFLPEINTEALEQYVLSVFEDSDCPYLVEVASTSIQTPTIILPDGSVAEENLLLKRVSVSYSTTDGMGVNEYNQSVSVIENGVANQAEFDALIESMVWAGSEAREGYDEFLNALRTITDENPSCIRINMISAEEIGGALIVKAEIDFYAGAFTNRVSSVEGTVPYVNWAGRTNVATDAGIIGMPFYCDNPNSSWFNIIMGDSDAVVSNRPFATYYSTAIFNNMVNAQGLAATLGLEDVGLSADSNATPGAGDAGEDAGETVDDPDGAEA